MARRNVKIGVDEAELRQRGEDIEGDSLLPTIPDFLGYILGFALLWVLYTAYHSAANVARTPITKISERASEIKDRVVSEYQGVDAKSAGAVTSVPEILSSHKKRGGWRGVLDYLNSSINQAVETVSDSAEKMLLGQEETLPVEATKPTKSPGASRSRPSERMPSASGKPGKGEALVPF